LRSAELFHIETRGGQLGHRGYVSAREAGLNRFVEVSLLPQDKKASAFSANSAGYPSSEELATRVR
jgi:hypothetical protein